MSLNPRNPRTKPRWLLTLAGVGAMTVLVAGVALAGLYQSSLEGSNFEIDTDANQTVDNLTNLASIDWKTSGIGIVPKADQPSGSGDNSFTQGTKEDTAVPVIESGSIPPNKSDLSYFGIYQEQVPQAGNTPPKSFVHIFWSRVQDPSGTTNMDFEFNQSKVISSNGVTPLRTAGDLLITYDLSRGGTQPTISLRVWSGDGVSGSWGAALDITAALGAAGTINRSTILAADSLVGRLDPRTFGEASINLDFIFNESDCKAFGSVYLKSRSSDSFTAALKDFIAPQPVNISNCGSLTVEKITQGSSAAFSFASTGGLPSPAAADGSFSLTTSAAGATGKDSKGFSDIQAGDYTITETIPSGWENVSLVCTGATAFTTGSTATTVTANITIDPDDQVTCTFTNGKLPELKIVKATVPTTDLGKFNLQIDSVTKKADAGNGDTTGFVIVSAGSHTVSEAAGTGTSLANYDSSISCTNGASGTGTSLSTGTLAYGDTVTCTITNSRLPQLKVVKATVPTTDLGKFNLQIDSVTKKADAGNGDDTGFVNVTAATHTVGETAGTDTSLADYDKSISCSNLASNTGSATLSTGTLAYGDKVTCTITNTRKATVIVKKVMVGGTDTFAFTGTPNASISANNGTISATVSPGQYVSTEGAKSGWDLTSVTCSDANSVGSVAGRSATFNAEAGETVTCTFTNTALYRVIVLVCNETNDDLYASKVYLGGVDEKTTISSAPDLPGYTVAQDDLMKYLCSLEGARYNDKPSNPTPGYNINVRIPNPL